MLLTTGLHKSHICKLLSKWSQQTTLKGALEKRADLGGLKSVAALVLAQQSQGLHVQHRLGGRGGDYLDGTQTLGRWRQQEQKLKVIHSWPRTKFKVTQSYMETLSQKI